MSRDYYDSDLVVRNKADSARIASFCIVLAPLLLFVAAVVAMVTR